MSYDDFVKWFDDLDVATAFTKAKSELEKLAEKYLKAE
jgi:hypothetical protein